MALIASARVFHWLLFDVLGPYLFVPEIVRCVILSFFSFFFFYIYLSRITIQTYYSLVSHRAPECNLDIAKTWQYSCIKKN